MIEQQLLVEALKLMQREYNFCTEIQQLTKEMGDVLSRNDLVSARMLLEMRGNEMKEYEECDRKLKLLVSSLPQEDSEALNNLIHGKEAANVDGFEAEKILSIRGNIRKILEETIKIDKRINLKMAGKDSFYRESE